LTADRRRWTDAGASCPNFRLSFAFSLQLLDLRDELCNDGLELGELHVEGEQLGLELRAPGVPRIDRIAAARRHAYV
jgi:hypothetical protein